MEPDQKLIDEIYREKVLRARRRGIEEKLLAGAELFEEVCQRMDWGIQAEFPTASAGEVKAIRSQRLERLRKLQDHNVWK